MNYYNTEKLVKVTVNDFSQGRWFEYKKEKRIFGFVTRKAGIYGSITGQYYGDKLMNCKFIDGVLHELPEVTLHYQNNHSKTYYFETYEEAQKFAEEITSSGKFIKSNK